MPSVTHPNRPPPCRRCRRGSSNWCRCAAGSAIAACTTCCARNHLESIGDTEHSLGTAEIEEAVGRHDLSNATQHLALGGLVEVDQHVAAEHHVELPEHRRIVEQIERLVGDHAADFLADAPLLRSEEHTSELQSLMRISYAVFFSQ